MSIKFLSPNFPNALHFLRSFLGKRTIADRHFLGNRTIAHNQNTVKASFSYPLVFGVVYKLFILLFDWVLSANVLLFGSLKFL